MLIVSDHRVVGAAAALQRAIVAGRWQEFAELLDLRFLRPADLGLASDAKDVDVWPAAQQSGAILITGIRSGGGESPDRVIEERSGPECFPVVTIADPRRVIHDPGYAASAAVRLLDLLIEIDSWRGVGRIFIP